MFSAAQTEWFAKRTVGGFIIMFPFFIVFSVLIASMSWAGESVPIGVVLASPESYQLHVITLQGVVEKITPFDPYFDPFSSRRGICYGAYSFTLKDDTGSIEVDHLPLCASGVKVPEMSIGDRVLVDAQIHVPGRSVEQGKDLPRKQNVAQAIAKGISRLGE